MIVFTKGGDDLELPIHASLIGLQLEEVVLDYKDAAALANSSDGQPREWAERLRVSFITPKRATRAVC